MINIKKLNKELRKLEARIGAKMEARMGAMINGLYGLGNTVPNSPAPVSGVSLNNPAIAALIQAFTKALQDGGYISKKPLDQRNVANDDAALTLSEPFNSISGLNPTLWKLKELKNKVLANNFVADLPAFSSVAAYPGQGYVRFGAPSNTWSPFHANTVSNEYKKLFDIVNELKTLLGSLEIK